MPHRRLAAIFLLGTAMLPTAHADTLPREARSFSFVLAGQSNMSGRGSLSDLQATERLVDPHILLFGNDGRIRPAREPLDAAEGQIDDISADRLAAVGPGLFFARTFRAMTGGNVLLIPCAKGGSSIDRWRPNTTTGSLYGSCLTRMFGQPQRVDGILWYQGESDAESEAKAAQWSQAFTQLVQRWRHDLRAPRLPVIYVQLSNAPASKGQAGRFRGWHAIQQSQQAIELPCTAQVSARGLPHNADDLHLSTDAQRRLGPELARAMTKLIDQGCG